MSRNRVVVGDKPTEAEQAALRWHRRHHRSAAAAGCWCCCMPCRKDNPRYAAARAAASADITARILSLYYDPLPLSVQTRGRSL